MLSKKKTTKRFYQKKKQITKSILETLLAPKTLWTAANLWGSWGEKYGEKGHSSAQRRRSSLQAAHGVTVFNVVPGGIATCLLIPITAWSAVFSKVGSFFTFFTISWYSLNPSLSFPISSTPKSCPKDYFRKLTKIIYILYFNLPISGHPRMLVISLFLRASMKEETWRRRRGEMEEIELLNKRETH